jgi:hypothetical protein
VDIHQVGAGAIVDVQRRLHQTAEFHLQLPALFLIQVAGSELLLIDEATRRSCVSAASRQTFEREHGDRARVLNVRGDVVREFKPRRSFPWRAGPRG